MAQIERSESKCRTVLDGVESPVRGARDQRIASPVVKANKLARNGGLVKDARSTTSKAVAYGEDAVADLGAEVFHMSDMVHVPASDMSLLPSLMLT